MTAAIQVSSQILNILLRYIDEEGIANADFRSRIEAAKSVDRISIEHWWGLLEELATLHPIPALGIQIGMRGEIQDAGILGYLAASCDSLVEAVARLQRFEPLLQNLSHSWTISISAGKAVVMSQLYYPMMWWYQEPWLLSASLLVLKHLRR